MSKSKKDNVHLKLSEELEGIDAELSDAMDALTATNERIDTYLNDDGEIPQQQTGGPAAEIPDEDETVQDEAAKQDDSPESDTQPED